MKNRSPDSVPPEILRAEPLVVAAVREMVGDDHLPHPRQLFSKVFIGERYPLRYLAQLQFAAIRAGRSVDQVLAPVRANEAWVRSFYAATEPALLDCMVAETKAQALLDEAELMSMQERSDANLERLVARADQHLTTLTQLRNRAARELVMRRTGRAAS